jgi:16S rRNA C1402 N4-methylase RsmH
VFYREISGFVEDFLAHLEDKSIEDKRVWQLVDGTFGGGGHSVGLLRKHPDNLRVLGIDLDTKVLDRCRQEYGELIADRRLALEHSNYVNIPHI